MKTLTLKANPKMYHFDAIDIVFDYFCMMVDNKTDPMDYHRHMITAIHQAENYCELVRTDLLTDIRQMEVDWYYGKL